ncbi:hypothetical protein CANARDRAFT_216638 [[Candida] arabinofermentans NRRL YB-2248]|uniref:Uncharacterized protein n=1 Tax=[Candida] arabinofermentans NRRL YB-2248 TaxID=983967 RepID=A0A1E4T9E4_9ASCO|nr:hypothetical protein CANARDRAFT_216638 [[Candida] arabinofermentans NRRL YB-2248]
MSSVFLVLKSRDTVMLIFTRQLKFFKVRGNGKLFMNQFNLVQRNGGNHHRIGEKPRYEEYIAGQLLLADLQDSSPETFALQLIERWVEFECIVYDTLPSDWYVLPRLNISRKENTSIYQNTYSLT